MPAANVVASSAAVELRAWWRPGLGLALWRSDGSGERPAPLSAEQVPAALAEFLIDRAFRRTIPRIGADGTRVLEPCVVLGRTTTVALLSAVDEPVAAEVGGDLRYYRRLLEGVEAACASGAVAPAVARADEEYHLRWELVATRPWRSWLAAMVDCAPESLTGGDSRNAGATTADFIAAIASSTSPEAIEDDASSPCWGFGCGVEPLPGIGRKLHSFSCLRDARQEEAGGRFFDPWQSHSATGRQMGMERRFPSCGSHVGFGASHRPAPSAGAPAAAAAGLKP